MPVSDSGWIGWVLRNRIPAAGFALCLLVASADLGVISARTGDDGEEVVAGEVDETTTTETLPGETTTTVEGTDTTAVTRTTTKKSTVTTEAGPATTLPGQPPAPPCRPKEGYKATGIDEESVTIGQIVSDVSVLPAQLYPNYEGLQAYVKLVNAAGGVCGREIKLQYSNDSANPATHDYEAMTHRVFAFVANSSLIDSSDYESNKPFNPRYQDNGEYVPDVGGLAYSYARSQSQWFAGTFGSLSPSLTGGGAVKTMLEEAKAPGFPHGPCRKAGVVYLREPTGASEDQGTIGAIALAADWGGNLGTANVKKYVANLADQAAVYQQMANQMVLDGVNCAFTYSDLGSNINFVKGLRDAGVWPHDKCSGTKCFSVVYMPFAAYDPKFIRDVGDASRGVSTFLPHLPLNETGHPAMQQYLSALGAVKDAEPSTFSIVGYASGIMFVEALQSCGEAPTRLCVMEYLRNLKDFTAGGLIGAQTPFRSTRVACNGDCGSFSPRGVFDFKWIFHCWAMLRISDRDGKRDFYRHMPAEGYTCDELRIARGSPA